MTVPLNSPTYTMSHPLCMEDWTIVPFPTKATITWARSLIFPLVTFVQASWIGSYIYGWKHMAKINTELVQGGTGTEQRFGFVQILQLLNWRGIISWLCYFKLKLSPQANSPAVMHISAIVSPKVNLNVRNSDVTFWSLVIGESWYR